MGTTPSPTFSTTVIGSATNQQQWLRACKLVVSGASGNTLDLSKLRVKFRVQSQTINTLKNAEITVYNLSPDTAKAIFSQQEFTTLTLSAGYLNTTCAQILVGQIVYLKMGREEALTSYLTITAVDSDEAYNWGTINEPLEAGATPQFQLSRILTALQPFNITAGYIPALTGASLPRGKVLYGSIKGVLDQFASSVGRIWSIHDGVLDLYESTDTRPISGDVVTLTPRTGLIGVPEQTLDGLNVRCFLNPAIRQGSLVQIPQQYIAQTSYTGAQPNLTLPVNPSLSNNSIYRVYALTQVGDTRGPGADWYSEMICVATDKSAQLPISNTFLTAVPGK